MARDYGGTYGGQPWHDAQPPYPGQPRYGGPPYGAAGLGAAAGPRSAVHGAGGPGFSRSPRSCSACSASSASGSGRGPRRRRGSSRRRSSSRSPTGSSASAGVTSRPGRSFPPSVSYPAPAALDDDPSLTLTARAGRHSQAGQLHGGHRPRRGGGARPRRLHGHAAGHLRRRDGQLRGDRRRRGAARYGRRRRPRRGRSPAPGPLRGFAPPCTRCRSRAPRRPLHRQAAAAVRCPFGGHVRRALHGRLCRQPAEGAGHGGQLHGRGDDERGSRGGAGRAVRARRAGAAARAARGRLDAEDAENPDDAEDAEDAWPGAGVRCRGAGARPAARRCPRPGRSPRLPTGIRDSQQWVFNMLNVQPAWQVTEGAGVTVAVIDSGVYPQRVRPVGRLGHLRTRLHRAAHLAAEPRLGPARHVDGVHHRRARPRRRLRRDHGDRAGGQDPLDPGDTGQG